MGYHLSYFDDTYGSGAVADEPLAAAHRIFYVFDGEAVIEGRTVETGGAIYASGAADIRGGSQGARVFRWDLSAFPPAAGEDAPSIPRMTQPIWSLETEPGSRGLFRLDRIDNAPGIVADVHTHPGRGIRALLAGTFHVRQPSEDGAAARPGDPWWESGVEAVISTSSAVETSSFLRCMPLPTQSAGRSDTARWLRQKRMVRAGLAALCGRDRNSLKNASGRALSDPGTGSAQ